MTQEMLFKKPSPLLRKFLEFHRENPSVYEALRSMALALKAKGHAQWGIASLFEVLRWKRAMETRGDPWKLNNNLRSGYARLLMKREPALRGFFAIRKSEMSKENQCEP